MHPFEDKEATMVLVSGVRGGRNDAVVGAPVVVYRDSEHYTERFLHIYSD